MAWNPSPKVADCRDIARKWDVQEVVILAVDKINGTLQYASYGQTKELCREAKQIADVCYGSVMEWAQKNS